MSHIDLKTIQESFRLNGHWLLSLSLLALFFAPAYGEIIAIGGGPGTLEWDGQHSDISVIDFTSNPGQIQPAQTGPEDNIALKIIERGGTVTSPNARIVLEISRSNLEGLLKNMVNGDSTKAFEVKGVSATGIIFRIDLGERLGVNRIRFFPRKGFEEFFLQGYELLLNDGSEEQKTLAGTPDFKVFKNVERNLEPIVDLDVPLQFVRFIEVRQLVRGEWEIDEFQVFGAGFASSASYTSKIFDHGQPAVFGGITWAKGSIGEQSKTGVTLSTRSGSTPDPGDSLAWSAWSAPYPAGVRSDIVSPAPRRYSQFRFQLETSEILSAATVDSIAFEVAPALADSLVGEIWPQSALIGQNTLLTYTVKTFNSRGFDRLAIDTLAPVEIVRSVQIDGTEVAWEKTDISGGVEISFPRVTGNQTLRVAFENVALRYNTFFAGRVTDSQQPENLPQAITEGDAAADSLARGNDLSVTIRVGKDLIHSFTVAPAPFTPNGDGINDELQITYDIVNLIDRAQIFVAVYDLTGRVRKVIYSGLNSSGRYRKTWDGTDASGAKVAPGIYLLRIEIDADSGAESKTKIVPVAY
ncbi:MAG: hypothetical protein HOK90_16515 [Gemmatimonadetes bacterium]|nr:hypothetical protein [Gemmatimonadota bacterium]